MLWTALTTGIMMCQIAVSHYVPPCPLMAISGHSEGCTITPAFPPKADIHPAVSRDEDGTTLERIEKASFYSL